MRKLLFSTLFLFTVALSHAATKTVIGNAGLGWANASNWSPAGVPVSGDEVIIPSGQIISVKGQIYGTPANLAIQVVGTLDFDPSGKLELDNSSYVNVYSGGQITSGGTSSELIVIGGVTKYNGQNDGTLTGPIHASSSTGQSVASQTGGGFNLGLLPINLTYFNYSVIDNTVKLSWKLIQDSDWDVYIVQRKVSGNWEDLHTRSASGITGTEISHQYIDVSPSAETLYRLKLVDGSGAISYSRIIRVILNQKAISLNAFPNPARNAITISWHKPLNAKISFYNSAGMLVIEENLKQKSELQVNTQSLQNGNYIAVVSSENLVLGKILFTVTH